MKKMKPNFMYLSKYLNIAT